MGFVFIEIIGLSCMISNGGVFGSVYGNINVQGKVNVGIDSGVLGSQFDRCILVGGWMKDV